MGLIKVEQNNKLTITYGGREAPFGGLDSSRAPAFIEPNNFASISNFISVDGELCPFGWQQIVGNVNFVLPTTNITPVYFTDLTVYPTNSTGSPSTAVIGMFVTITNNGGNSYSVYLNVTQFSNISQPGQTTVFSLIKTTNFPSGGIGTICYKNINGTLYISGSGFGTVFSYANGTLTNLNTTIGGVPTGAMIISELNSRLLLINTNQINGGAYSTQPYQIAWSAPNNYGQFEPLVGGLITGAGYNNLPDVEDQITGIINSGPTATLIREQGLTEMVPASSGIQPYTFQHFSVSHKGIGAQIPATVCQYGNLGAFLHESGICLLTSGNLNYDFAGKAWESMNAAIQAALNSITYIVISMTITPIFVNNKTYPVLILRVGTQFWIGDLNSGAWTTLQTPTYANANYYFSVVSVYNLVQYPAYNRQAVAALIVQTAQGAINVFSLYNNPAINANLVNLVPSPLNLTFPIEIVSEYADITIDSIIVWVYLSAALVAVASNTGITFSLVGYNFAGAPTPATLFGAIPTYNALPGYQQIVLYPVKGVFTTRNVQLVVQNGVTSSVLGFAISKIQLTGTVDATQRP